METMDYRSVPLVLLAATWAAVDTALKGAEILNKRKDDISALAARCRPGSCLRPSRGEHT